MDAINWTHVCLHLTDIRKISEYYLLTISTFGPATVFTVKDKIFEERLRAYFLTDISKITREQILTVKWNFYISKGEYIKINKNGEIQKFKMDEDKSYISYLEIEGPIAKFQSIFKEKEIINKQ